MTPLHHVGQALREALQSVPLSAVRALFVVSLCLILIWVIRLPRQSTEPESGAKRWDENLKPLAVVALLIQIVIYMVF